MDIWDERTPHSNLSGLVRLELKSDDPYDLFNEWYEETRKYSTGLPNALCLATVSKDRKVSARHVILRQMDESGFTIVTDERSRKSCDLAEVPYASMCFLWSYLDSEKHHISRQVRIEGPIEKLKKDDYSELYEREPLFCKVRSHLCQQGVEIEWEELKERHDSMLRDATEGKIKLPMPDHFVAFKLTPVMMEFYSARDHFIGDRMLFRKDDPAEIKWRHCRIAA